MFMTVQLAREGLKNENTCYTGVDIGPSKVSVDVGGLGVH